jgi:hypothetical protein
MPMAPVFALSALLLATWLGTPAARAAAREDGYAVIYDGAIAMEKLPRRRGNLYPWLDPSEVYIGSCGFARITYKEVDVVAFLAGDDYFSTKKSSFYDLMGEWCEVADSLMETSYRAPHVIAYRKWDGKKYLLSRADVYIDNEGTAYVADKFFVEENELQALVRPIAQGADNTGCFDEKRAPTETLEGASGLVRVGNLLCVTKGAPLRDFVLRIDKLQGHASGG